MQTTHKKVADSLLLTIQIAPDDYLPDFQKNIKTYAQQVNARGFRPNSQGHFTLVKKRYGNAILRDILSKKVNEEVDRFLAEEKLLFVGNHSLKEEFEHVNKGKPSSFSFEVEIAAVPDFTLPPFKEIEAKGYEVSSVAPEDVDNYIKMKQLFYSQEVTPQAKVHMHDHVTGHFKDDKKRTFTFVITPKVEEHTAIVGKKKKDILTLNKKAKEALAADIYYRVYQSYDALKKDKESEFVIVDIEEKKPCSLDEAFFNRCIGGAGQVKNLTEFKKLMQQALLNDTQKTADSLLEDNIIKAYEKKLNLKIPHYIGQEALVRVKGLIIDKLIKAKSFEINPADMIHKLIQMFTLSRLKPGLSFDSKKVQQEVMRDVEATMVQPESEAYQQAYYSTVMEKGMDFIKEKITLHKEKISLKAFKDMLLSRKQRVPAKS